MAEEKLDFSGVLASTIHDMKNSLGMVLNSLDEIVDPEAGKCRCTPEKVAQIQYEARRVNDNLIQLLTLYKVEKKQYIENITELPVADFLEECYLANKPLMEYRQIPLETECDDDLIWFFDRDLLIGVIDNVINNAMRYTRNRIKLAASEEDGWLHIRIEDDGPGFPPHMLQAVDRETDLDFRKGHTGLGLYFCSQVAALHVNQGREGYIALSNDGELGGGRISIYLP